MKLLKLFIFASLITSQMAMASSNFRKDPVGDVDLKPSTACVDLQTDMVGTDLIREGDNFVMRMTMSKAIDKTQYGYREYYFWLDITDSEQGYQPYMPDSAAWPDMSADMRIFYSMQTNQAGYVESEGARMQNCLNSLCWDDKSMESTSDVKVQINGNVVSFTWPAGLIPSLEKKSLKKNNTIKVGYTTYFETYNHCSGEDDSPQWGKNSWVLTVPKTSQTTPVVPAPVPVPVPPPSPE